MIPGLDVALDAARLRGWGVERIPIQMMPSMASSVTLTGHVRREAHYRVKLPMMHSSPRHAVWEIEENLAGATVLLGLLVQEGL